MSKHAPHDTPVTIHDLDAYEGLRGYLRRARGIAQLTGNQQDDMLDLLTKKSGLTAAMDALIEYLDRAETLLDRYLRSQGLGLNLAECSDATDEDPPRTSPSAEEGDV